MNDKLPPPGLPPIRDLPDFALRWHEFRAQAVQLQGLPMLGPENQMIIAWLIQMADKITAQDIKE